jgi:CDGSH-type Zn-finger protein
VISGNLTLTSAAGLPTWSGTRVALCRCGESSNKPFCDGTHALVGFTTDAG